MKFLKNKYALKNIFYLSIFPLLLITFTIFLYKNSFDIGLIYNDISDTYDIPIYGGLFSTLGIFLWTCNLITCLFTRQFLLKIGDRKNQHISFYNYSCILNFLLLIDDQFLLHEKGNNDNYFFILYLTLTFYLIKKLKKIIQKKELIYFLTAIIFFLGSILIDINDFLDISIFFKFAALEDSFKLIGIYFWSIFFWTISLRIIIEKKNKSNIN